ncbi:MAG: hypothetical protein AAGC45_13565 [Bacteroidota bacterium]
MKTLNPIVGILAIISVIYTFFETSETYDFFGIGLNVWGYRLIWVILAAGCFYGYYKRKLKTAQ